jgi:hypothetical protein
MERESLAQVIRSELRVHAIYVARFIIGALAFALMNALDCVLQQATAVPTNQPAARSHSDPNGTPGHSEPRLAKVEE